MRKSHAFLAQANADFRLYETLERSTIGRPCHRLMLLQMSTEKLAKAIRLTPSGGVSFKPSHAVFAKLSHVLRRQRTLAHNLKMAPEEFESFVDRTLALRADIAQLSPQVAGDGRPNAEYPWEHRDASGEVHWTPPCEHEFEILDKLRSPDGYALLKLIGLLLDRFDRLF